jgi:uncharacterized membrane protein YhaH (DUF805 family)
VNWYLKVLKNYVGFEGRSTRTEYWMFVLFNFIFSAVITLLAALLVNYLELTLFVFLPYLYSIAVLLPSLAVSVRRLHDIGKSGWWILISLIPFIGSIILIVFYCQDSQTSENQYGTNPKMYAN